ncbi:MAG: hypothetical protein ACREOQ_21760 [Gemmatimonadales bacterium]
MNGNAPIYLTALAAAIMAAAVLILQPYSARSPWDAYSAPVRRYCREFASDTLADNAVSARAHRALGFDEVALIRCFRKPLDPLQQRGPTGPTES